MRWSMLSLYVYFDRYDFFQDVYALAFKREVFVAHSIQLQS